VVISDENEEESDIAFALKVVILVETDELRVVAAA
jgi:hypothetical protein